MISNFFCLFRVISIKLTLSESNPFCHIFELTRDIGVVHHVNRVGPSVRSLFNAASKQEVILGEVWQVTPPGVAGVGPQRFVVLHTRVESEFRT